MLLWNDRFNMDEGINENMPPPIVILSAYSLSEKQPGFNTAVKVSIIQEIGDNSLSLILQVCRIYIQLVSLLF